VLERGPGPAAGRQAPRERADRVDLERPRFSSIESTKKYSKE
jgi:hypothetical protein